MTVFRCSEEYEVLNRLTVEHVSVIRATYLHPRCVIKKIARTHSFTILFYAILFPIRFTFSGSITLISNGFSGPIRVREEYEVSLMQ